MNLSRTVLGCYRGASLLTHVVKNLPTMQKTQVWSLSWEKPLEKDRQPTPVFLPGEVHGHSSLVGYSLRGPWESDTTKQLTHTDTGELGYLGQDVHVASEMPPAELGCSSSGSKGTWDAGPQPAVTNSSQCSQCCQVEDHMELRG